MSTFQQFAGGGSGIKSIQRGTITGNSSATITAVNPAKTELRNLGSGIYAGQGADNTARISLTNSTTITAVSGYGQCTVSWELTEWN